MTAVTRYVWAINAAGWFVILASIVTVLISPVNPIALVLAGLATLGGFSVLRLRSISASFSLGDAFTLTALFLEGPEFGALAVALETSAISFRLGGAPRRVLFNSAAPALAMWGAGWFTFRVAGLPLPAAAPDALTMATGVIVSVALYFLFGSSLVAAAVALDQRGSVQQVWREHFAGLWVSPTAGGYIGMLVALLSREIGTGAVVAVLPMPVIVYQMLRTSLARTDDQLRHLEAMNRTYASTIEAFATAVDAKDQVTHGHLRRVQVYALGVARELGITDGPTLRSLEAAALLHDVGKIGIPEHILNKPGKLTSGEFEEMKRHVTIGADILSAVDFPFPVVPIVRHHHENWDGTGYPDGVRGMDIPIGARILMVVDCFDALTSDRPYRPAMSREDAFDILRERRGRMYDPDIVDRFIEIQPRLSETLGPEPKVAPAELHVAVGGARVAPASRRRLRGRPRASLWRGCWAMCSPTASRSSTKSIRPASCVVAKAARGRAARTVIGHRLSVGQGVSGWVSANNHAIDDTDAALDLAGVLPAAEIAGLSCTSVPMSVAGRRIVVTVYGPRSGTAQRAALVRGLNQYLQTAVQPGPQSAPAALTAVDMAKAS